MARCVDEGKRLVWRRRLARYARGRHTVGAFCAAEGIPVATFYHWRRRRRAEAAEPNKDRPHKQRPTEQREFLPVRIKGRAVVELELPNGACVRVPSSDAAVISALIAAAGRLTAAGQAEA